MMNKVYMCIDLKSFYASVECVERKLDPLTTNLVVADSERTEKTICLAVSPSLKKYGLSGRSRLFEVVSKVKEINRERKKNNNYKKFTDKSYDSTKLNNKSLELDYIIAKPRMSLYMKYSSMIYNIYLKFLASEDIYVYSIDEVFCDITNYLKLYNLSPKELVTKIIREVYKETGITATAGIGTNLYLSKVAMDIVAKHVEADKYGVRIAELDEMNYRKLLWTHKPLTDFWRVGRGYAKKLNEKNIYTMGDIARVSLDNEELLYKLFGINAELLIDHAWGWEPCTLMDIKSYKPKTTCMGTSQVLHCPYDYNKAKLIVKEMANSVSLDLVSKKLVSDQFVLTVGYDISNLENNDYYGEITTDHYGRKIPKHAHGTINLEYKSSSSKLITKNIIKLYEKIVNKKLLIRRIGISANNLSLEEENKNKNIYKQLDLFSDNEKVEEKLKTRKLEEKDENELQKVVLDIKNKYGKNSIVLGMDLEDGATTIARNNQIGGHRA